MVVKGISSAHVVEIKVYTYRILNEILHVLVRELKLTTLRQFAFSGVDARKKSDVDVDFFQSFLQ